MFRFRGDISAIIMLPLLEAAMLAQVQKPEGAEVRAQLSPPLVLAHRLETPVVEASLQDFTARTDINTE